ncbi:hypothetical protein cypCar_00014984 [Cyprinus carpio]|nr:hypothetical protein cypCar_00014984 [Cyprinus carpio]
MGREYPLSLHDNCTALQHTIDVYDQGFGRKKCLDECRQRNSHFYLCHYDDVLSPVSTAKWDHSAYRTDFLPKQETEGREEDTLRRRFPTEITQPEWCVKLLDSNKLPKRGDAKELERGGLAFTSCCDSNTSVCIFMLGLLLLPYGKQLPIGRSQSWDTLGGNEGHWERSDGVYEQQARMAGRRNSLRYGADAGGGWYEPPPGVRHPDLDLKREQDSYQESLYNQGYLDPPDPRNTPVAPVDPKKNADPEFLALLQKEGVSESTITSLLQQGFDSTKMLAVMEENDVRSVAPNLGQARVLSRVVLGCKRPPEILPATPLHPSAPVRGRSNSFSHRSDIYVHQPPPLTPGLESQYMQPPSTQMQTISPRMGEGYSRRPSSAPSQQFFETSGYPGARSAGAYGGAMVPVQPRPLSGYNPHAGLPMSPMTAMSQQVAIPSHLPGIPPQIHAMPQPFPALPAVPQPMTVSALPPQQAPKAYTTNYTVPMELMKRDRSLATMSPMPSPHVSPQVMRKAGASSDRVLVPIGGAVPGQNASLANQKLSRRTGPPVIVSTMASPDTT